MRRFASLIAFSALALSACKPPTPSYTVTDPETGKKSKISVNQGEGTNTVTIDSGDTKGKVSVSGKGDAPKNMPAYVPNYPGAVYEGSFSSDIEASKAEGGPVKGGMVSFKTNDAPDKVVAFYKEAFTRAGLKESGSANMAGLNMTSFTKEGNDQEGAQIMTTPSPDGGTQVQVMYSAVQ